MTLQVPSSRPLPLEPRCSFRCDNHFRACSCRPVRNPSISFSLFVNVFFSPRRRPFPARFGLFLPAHRPRQVGAFFSLPQIERFFLKPETENEASLHAEKMAAGRCSGYRFFHFLLPSSRIVRGAFPPPLPPLMRAENQLPTRTHRFPVVHDAGSLPAPAAHFFPLFHGAEHPFFPLKQAEPISAKSAPP